MGDDNGATDTPPIWFWRGIELYGWDGMIALALGSFRLIGYDPRDRDNWKLDCIFDSEVWQIGIGPLVLCYFWED